MKKIVTIFLLVFITGVTIAFKTNLLTDLSAMQSTIVPQPLTPQDGSQGVSINPKISWTSVPGAVGYELQVSLYNDFYTINASNISTYSLIPAFPNLSFKGITEIAYKNNKMYVTEDTGYVRVFDNSSGVLTKKTFLDMTSLVTESGQTGLMGIAFHPDYAVNSFFYVHCIKSDTLLIYRFTASPVNPDSASVNTKFLIMRIAVLYPGHYGGKIVFGQDGFLYFSTGDSGNGTDTSGTAARKLTTLWGKLIRIDVDNPSGGRNYGIPASNPYYNNSSGYREEIYARGFRNLWKFSIESDGKIWAADVGEHYREEIDLVYNGGDYGWSKMEGELCFPDSSNCDTTGLNLILPIYSYPHFVGPVNSTGSITGGYIYKGSEFSGLYNKYIHGDFVKGKVWALTYDSIHKSTSDLLLDTTYLISTFGKDENDRIYVCSYNPGKIYKLYNPPYTDTSFTVINPINTLSQYYWRVREIGGNWSVPYTFMTSTFESESMSMFANMPTITDEEKILMDSAVKGFKSYGLWSKFYLIYCFATLDTGIANTNWISSGKRAVSSGLMTFIPNEGYNSDGVTGRMSTQWIPSQNSSFLNSGSMGVYSRTDIDEPGRVLSSRAAENSRLLLILRSSNSTQSRINSSSSSLQLDTNTDSRGFFLINRSSSSSIQNYQNGVMTGAGSALSGSLSTQPVTIFCNNDNGTFASYSNAQISWVVIGSSFDSTEQANLDKVIQRFMTRKGKQIEYIAPAISYSTLPEANDLNHRNLQASITDSDGIDTTTGNRPRIYFKKSTDENTFVDNTNLSSGWKYAEATNSSSPFEFTIDYILLDTISAGDSVQYFVIAQDLAAIPLVSVNSGVLASVPSNVNLTSAAFPITGSINSYRINDAPVISYTALEDVNDLTLRNLEAYITDSNGIDTTTGNRPRIYFKKTADENTFVDNTNSSSGWKYSESTNSSSPFEFTIDYTLLDTISAGDSVQYFVIAQDLAAIPLVSVNSGTLSSMPSNVNLTSAAFPITGEINSYRINDVPVIAYALLQNAENLSNRILNNVVITDSDGIDTTAGYRPRIYFKKGTDENTFVDNTKLSNGWKFAEANNTMSPFEFTIDYTLLDTISAGDSVQYFVIAQDLAAIPLVSVNSGVLASVPSNVNLTLAAFPITGSINSYRINDAPVISYTALEDVNDLTLRNLEADITDTNGIDTTTNNRPRIYFKKSTDENTFVDNSNSSSGWKYSESTNSITPFEFTIDYILLDTISAGDSVQYFVIAQDLAATPLVSVNSGVLASVPSNVNLTSAAFPITGSINSYRINDAPVISYTALEDVNDLTLRNLEAYITDSNGIDTTTGNRPRIYFKKTADENTFVDNTNSSGGWKYAEATNSTTPFGFTIDYTLLDTISAGDSVQYFVIAQDLAATPLVSVNSGVLNSLPANVNLTSAAFPITGEVNSYRINDAPVISYTALEDVNDLTLRNLEAYITDSNGIDTTTGNRPRIYFKKTADENTFVDNTNSSGGWKYSEATNSTSPFEFTIDYTLLDTISAGDSVQYFVIAQDLAAITLVSVNSGTLSSMPANVNLTSAAFPITGEVNSYRINDAPVISYTALEDVNDLTLRNLEADITDSNGIDTTTGNRPRIYFKKTADENTFVDNTNSSSGWKYAEATNSTSPFEFTIDYTLLDTISAGDSVQYFVIAQDLAAIPLVSVNSGVLASVPSNVNLTSAAFPITGSINSYRINDAPVISYTALEDVNDLTLRNLEAGITDSNGIDTTTNNRPRIYFKKSTDENTFVDNTNSSSGWKYSEATNSSSPFEFTIDYTLLDTISAGDSVQYFVIAQDLAATPLVSVNSGVLNSLPANVNLTSAAFPITGVVNSYRINDAPVISYTVLADVNDLTLRNLEADITDSDGIDTTTGNRPRIYFKKTADENTFVDNTNLSSGWKYAEATNSSSPFEFTIDYTLLDTISAGDSVQYFVIAQDLAATPLVSVNSGTLSSIPANVNLTSAAFPITGEVNSYRINDAPVISYTALEDVNDLTLRNLEAYITDSNGIDTTTGNRPRIYFKKTADENTFVDNTNSSSGWKYAEATNSITPFGFTIDYTLLDTISAGDSLQYFVIAQDLAAIPLVSVNSGTLNSLPANVNLTSASFPITGEVNSYRINDAPVISYTALEDVNDLTLRNLEAGITDSNGIDTTTNNRPRIYFKKTADENTFVDNTNSSGGWKYSEATNSTSPFEFTIDYTLLDTISAGDSVQYFVIAQDLAAIPLVSVNSGTLSSMPANVNLTSAAFPITGEVNSYRINDVPVIAYALLQNAENLSNRILNNVMITDSNGIDTTAGYRPRIYFKKGTDENTFVDNTKLSNGWKFAEANNTMSPFEFTIDYSLVNGGGIVSGDSIQYFVIAQDLTALPAVGINSGSLSFTPAGVDLSSGSFPVSGTINSYLSSTKNIVIPKILSLTFRLEAIQFTRKDTITVNLRNSQSPYELIESASCLSDTISGISYIQYSLAENFVSYFVEVIHRNSITTWSNPFEFANHKASYSFTEDVCMAFGCNSVLVDGAASIYTGDVNRDGFVDLDDLIIISNSANSFERGYLVTDLDGNEDVSLIDLIIGFNNSTNYVSNVVP